MSYEGKMRRGKALYDFRDVDGNLPTEITIDKHKMEEVTFYLDNSKAKAVPKETKVVTKAKE